MKRTVICIVALFFSVILFAQTSSGTWNSATATYTNTKHNLSWKLIDELTWVGRPNLTESSLFKVRNDDTQILVKLGATHYDGPESDAWNYISLYNSKEYQDMMKAEAQRNGMTYKGITVAKSQLCGIHASKIKSDMTKYYPDQKATVHTIEYTYQLCKNNYVYTLGVTLLSALEEELDDYDRIVTKIFNGFSLK